MKPLILLLTPFLFLQQAAAQSPTGRYLLFSVSGGLLYPRHPGKDVTQNFGYTTIPDAGGGRTSQTFNGSLGHSFANPSFTGDFIGFEIAQKHHSIDFGIGLTQELKDNEGGYFRGGYRYHLLFKGFRLKAGLDLYYVIGGENKLGSIDNKDQEIDLLGYKAKSQWTETSSDDDGNTETDTHYVNKLDVLYQRNSFLAEPKIALTTTGKHFAFGLEAGWMFQLAQDAVIELQQSDTKGDNTHSVGRVSMNNNGSMGGPYVALTVGYYLWEKPKKTGDKPGIFGRKRTDPVDN
jgi:hypothetical protein